MSTYAPSQLVWLANQWEPLYGSAVLSGIVGDLAHKLRGGYHISIEDQPSDNYSVRRVDDKAPPGNWPRDRASAIDMTMNTADIKKCHIRLREAWKNRGKDVRMKYINAWNGWDGVGDAGRYDVITGTVSTATADHKWHIHLEIRRRYVNSREAMEAILSILKGETLEQYLGGEMPLDATDRDVIRTIVREENAKVPAQTWNFPLRNPYNDTDQPAGTILRYAPSRNPHEITQAMVQSVLNTVNSVLTAVTALPGVDVDENALAAAMSTNPAFVDALATAIAAKVVIPGDGSGGTVDPAVVKAAVVEALNNTRLSVLTETPPTV